VIKPGFVFIKLASVAPPVRFGNGFGVNHTIPMNTADRITTASNHTFVTDDGLRIAYRHCPATGPSSKAVILLHRGHEHSGRWSGFVEALGMTDRHLFAWDARGHGDSEGSRGAAPDFGVLVRDLETFYRHLVATHAVAPDEVVVIAQSVGAVVAATWAHDYAPPLRAMVLANPAFSIKLYVPFAETGLRLLGRVKSGVRIRSYVSGKMLTHDTVSADAYDHDPLVDRGIALNVLLGLADAGRRAPDDASNVRIPTLVMLSEEDFVVRHAPQEAYFKNLASPLKELRRYAAKRHALFNETGLSEIAGDAAGFIRRVETDADEGVREKLLSGRENLDEFNRLLAPASVVKAIGYAAFRAGLRTGGRLSAGVRLGLSSGFDSGGTLDYVYENRPTGFSFVGRAIDRVYLNSPGWRGIRTRRRNLEHTLADATARLRESGRAPRLVDIAAGQGRYAFETLAAPGNGDMTALLRDYDALNVAHLRHECARRGLRMRVKPVEGDAFDGNAPGGPDAHNLAVVSGLYELFHDNALVRRSLGALAESVETGGYLVYTGQPRHPQLELIARTLTSHRNGARWVMRRRSQAEMDALVAEAGFRKIDQRADADGIFTVSLAVKL
jgi:alpha-beta hydrolase superfamily lysophospholipase